MQSVQTKESADLQLNLMHIHQWWICMRFSCKSAYHQRKISRERVALCTKMPFRIVQCIILIYQCIFNSLWPSDAIWQRRSSSPQAQVMACGLTAPSYYMNQHWLIIKEVFWHSPEGNFTENAQENYPRYELEHYANLRLTHWGQVTHICIRKLTITGSDNGLSPGRRQAIIQTNAEILQIRTLGTHFSENLREIH